MSIALFTQGILIFFQIIFISLAYWVLLHHLKLKANAEYEKSNRSLQIYFHTLVWPNSFFQITSIVLLSLTIYENGEGAQLIGWVQMFQQCYWIMLGFIIAKYKSQDDQIQGVSKLSEIIKVSVFQRYKNKNLQKDQSRYTLVESHYTQGQGNRNSKISKSSSEFPVLSRF